MLDPDTIALLQSFGYGFAQNLISSAIVEWKKLKDDSRAQENATWLANVEHSKQIEARLSQKICEAFRNLTLTREQFDLLFPLASDSIFAGELARQIIADRYSAEEVASIIVRCSPSAEALGEELPRTALLLVGAIQSAIADDPHLHRTKELQFQTNITAQVAEIKAETSRTQQSIQESTHVVIEAFGQKVQEILTAQKALSDQTSESEIREKIYHDRVEQARKLLESGKPKTARQLFEGLRAEISGKNPSKSLLFRIATNIGSCAMQMDDTPTAIKEIDLAFQLDPENPKAITNLSITTLLKGRPEEAFRLAVRARQLVAQDSVATGNYIHALFALGRETELQQLIENERWITKDPNCCFVIGLLFFNRGRYAEAEKFYRLGLVADPAEPRLLVNLAHSLVRSIQAALLGEPILDWKFPADANPKFKEAEELLSRAIAVQDEFEDRRFFAFAHVLRADIRRMMGNEDAAIADCEIALHENPADESALPIKALAHLHAHQFDAAIATFERIKDAAAKERNLLPRATACNAAKKPEKVVSLLTPYWDTTPKNVSQIRIADQLLWAYSQLGNTTAANKIVEELQSAWPNVPEALAAVAHYRNQQGKTEEAIGLLTEALAYASGPPRDFIALQLADILYKRDQFSKAAELYESVADLTTNNDLSRRYLVCLYNSGPHKEALKLAQALRSTGEPIPFISQIEANILAEIGDLMTAQKIMERLGVLHPKHHEYKMAAAEFAMRRGRHAEARVFLEAIPFNEIRNAANILLRTAQIRAVIGMGDVLKYLYQARRVGYASSQVHADYVWLFVSREQIDNVDLTKQTVDGDCGVILQIGNERQCYTILSEDDLHPERGEISPDKAGEMQLLGRKKDDCFVFDKDAFGNEIQCTIVDVQSKYVRAFQETLEKFPALFPRDRTLQGIPGPYEKFREGLFRQLDEHQAALRQALSFYEAKKATFETLASLLRCSPIELWGTLTGGRYCAFANFSGTSSDVATESKIAAEADCILLDLTAILTFGGLGLLHRLAQRYKLFTTQPVLDVLVETLAKTQLEKPGLTVGKEGDNYVRAETTNEQLKARKEFFERIVTFVAENVTTKPVPSLLEKNDITHEMRELLGPISTASILASRAEKLVLHSEDQMLRLLAWNEWKIKGMSVQPILQELLSKSIVTKDECIEATARLFFMNFSVVLISADNLMWTFKRLEFRITDDTKKILAVFHGPQCTFESAMGVLAETTKQMWLESPLYHRKMDLLDAILDALGTNRPTNQVAQYFTEVIKLKLFLAPPAADAIAERVRLWKERKLGRYGLIIPPGYRSE